MTLHRSRTITGGLLAGLALATALAGCGGSSSRKPPVQAARPTASESNADVGSAAVQGGEALTPAPPGASTAPRTRASSSPGATRTTSSAKASTSSAKASTSSARTHHTPGSSIGKTVAVQKARSAGDTSNDDESSTGAKTLNPCTLVSVSEVQSITGGGFLSRVEAPLGPTCIYHVSGPPSNVTLAVEAASTAPAAHKGARQNVSVAGHTAYCVKLGSAMLLVPLSGGRVLNVTAPCALAQRFAAAALGHLTA